MKGGPMVPAGMNRKMFFERIAGLPAGDLVQVQNAYWLAKNAHRLQEPRDDGRRYFEHPREVAWTLIERGYTSGSVLSRAFCHDIIEDTNTPATVIVGVCGYDVWKSTLVLSKSIPVFDPVTGQLLARYRKPDDVYYAELLKGSFEERLVKCADNTVNTDDMKNWTPERQRAYALKTKKHILPIAQITDEWFYEHLLETVKRVLS